MIRLLRIILLFSAFNFLFGQTSNSIIINEFMASNISTIKDPQFQEFADWIEIYNAGENEIDISNYYLTDDPEDPTKWQISSTAKISRKSFRGFWADSKDEGFHTSFKLSKDGGFIGIYNQDTLLIDSVYYPKQYPDISYGRTKEEPYSWRFFADPTPAKINYTIPYLGISSKPEIVQPNGFYGGPINVGIISEDSLTTIYYTIDGSEPNVNSAIYSGSIPLSKTSVLKTIAIKESYIQSETRASTYFINESSTLPIFSIITDPANFFDDEIGIYVEGTNGITGLCSDSPRNWNQDWERPAQIEFYETDRSNVLKQKVGVKINGGCSRIYPQKSLALFARDKYDSSFMRYKFFNDRDVTDYKSLILRSSAQDWWRTMMRDGMMQTLFKGNLDIDYQEYRPAIVFLNGEYFGIHNLREKLNKYYLENLYDVDTDNIDLIELSKSIVVNQGDRDDYDNLISFISNNDLSKSEYYNYVKNLIDIDEYIDYNIAQIYVSNGDWPGHNVKIWKEKTPGAKWRWMIYDLDFGFGGNSIGKYDYNTLEHATDPNGPYWPNPPWSTLLLRRMLTNESFKNEFAQRFAYHVNTTFDTERVLTIIDSIQSLIKDEIPRHKERWNKSISFADSWESLVSILKIFADKRPQYVLKHFSDKFEFNGMAYLTVKTNSSAGGLVYFYDKKLTDSLYTGRFFKNSAIILKAQPNPGYKFVGWEGIDNLQNPTAEIILESNLTVKAVFEKYDSVQSSVVINEINYKSSSDNNSEDWVELVNRSDYEIDLSGWIFKDMLDEHNFTIPEGAKVSEGEFLVICKDTSAFKSIYNNSNGYLGNFDFGLSQDDEVIRIFNKYGFLVDSVHYKNEAPWPQLNEGNTLALRQIDLDNNIPGNWFLYEGIGTPGLDNSTITESQSISTEILEFRLLQNYPNPFNPATYISYQLAEESQTHLAVYDILGRKVLTLVNKKQAAGNYTINFNAGDLPSSVYFYTIKTDKGFSETKKMMLLK